jgi:hypothetical protein
MINKKINLFRENYVIFREVPRGADDSNNSISSSLKTVMGVFSGKRGDVNTNLTDLLTDGDRNKNVTERFKKRADILIDLRLAFMEYLDPKIASKLTKEALKKKEAIGHLIGLIEEQQRNEMKYLEVETELADLKIFDEKIVKPSVALENEMVDVENKISNEFGDPGKGLIAYKLARLGGAPNSLAVGIGVGASMGDLTIGERVDLRSRLDFIKNRLSNLVYFTSVYYDYKAVFKQENGKQVLVVDKKRLERIDRLSLLQRRVSLIGEQYLLFYKRIETDRKIISELDKLKKAG